MNPKVVERVKKKGKRILQEIKKPKSSKRRSQKAATQHDFLLGQGIEEYDLVKDLQHQRANITYGHMLVLSPKLRRQWTRSVNTLIRRMEKDNKDTMVVDASQDRDLVQVLDAVVEKKTWF